MIHRRRDERYAPQRVCVCAASYNCVVCMHAIVVVWHMCVFVVFTLCVHAIVDQIIIRWVGQMRDEGVTGWNSSQRDREHHTETFNFPGRGICSR